MSIKKVIFGDYLIHIASVRGNIDEMKTLLDNGADINAIGEHSYTALYNAVEQGYFNMVLFLLNQGANIHIKNTIHLTAKALANTVGNHTIYQMIDDFKNNLNPNPS